MTSYHIIRHHDLCTRTNTSYLRRALRFAGPFCASTSVFMLGHKSDLADTISVFGWNNDILI
jgi:hypothetical protein